MDLEKLTSDLLAIAETGDEQAWPTEGVRVLREAGGFKHNVPTRVGGIGAGPVDQLALYEVVASGSLTLALIMTQHDAAAEVLGVADPDSIADEILTKCATGEELLTVGISQITTSRRHKDNPMRARRDGDDFVLDGIMPWVTSSPKANHVVTAAVLEDGLQLLACVPTDAPGVSVREPLELLALQSSWTGEIACEEVRMPRSWVLRGPMEAVLSRRAPVKGLTVSSVGIGMAGALLREIRTHVDKLPGSDALVEITIQPRYEAARQKLLDTAGTLHDPASENPAVAIRSEINGVVNRLAATLMTLSKDTGFLTSHSTQRLLREASFFLVWSAAPAVQMETLNQIWDSP